MKKNGLLLLFFILFKLTGYSQDHKVLNLSIDSLKNLPFMIFEGWKFHDGDDLSMALTSYNDSSWKVTRSMINVDTVPSPFKGIGWFRLHFTCDSSVTGIPLAMTITQLGASEIYLDGKLIQKYGRIQGADSSEYFDPQELPFIFMIPASKEHVLAVRYANYNSASNNKIYDRVYDGFILRIGETDRFIKLKDVRSTVFTLVLMFIVGFFFSFFLIHFFMYLHYKRVRSNLYFSIFILSLAIGFVIAFIFYASRSPGFELKSAYLLTPLVITTSFALSGFINELFSKRKLRFHIIAGFSLLSMLFFIFRSDYSDYLIVTLVISVAFEALFTVIFAIIKRTKGARIIGAGILFFTIFVLSIIFIAMVQGVHFDLNDSTTEGRMVILILGMAIVSIPVSMSVYLAWNFSAINKNLALQLEQVQLLSQKTIEQEQEKQKVLETKKEELEKEVWQRTSELREEKKKSDDLLLNILPAEVAEELKLKGSSVARDYELVTVMFTDFKDFTKIGEQLSPAQLVAEIDYCFSAFDEIINKYGVEKIKTIGDAYMCAGGLPTRNQTHATDIIKAALEIRDFMANHNKEKLAKGELLFEIRIGINTGSVVAGIVGIKKFAYDVWGDTVNIASRMENSSEPGKINISGTTYELVKAEFNCSHRGKIQIKNKGEVDMYFVEGKHG